MARRTKRSSARTPFSPVSLATAKAAANQLGLSLFKYLGGPNAKVLPVPMMNIVNGGAHSDAPVDFQEFMIMPKGADTFSEALRCGVEIFHSLKACSRAAGLSTAVGDEGGFAPNFNDANDALETIATAVKKAGYKLGKEVFFALDVAASEFYDKEKKQYVFKKSDGSKRTRRGTRRPTTDALQKKFPIISIEDGCAENDWDGLEEAHRQAMGSTTQLVGDDLFVTNVEFLKKGIDQGVANSILVKVNQIGSLTETLDAIELAKENRYTSVISHRSGRDRGHDDRRHRRGDQRGQIKTGSLSRTDRVAKYNQLLRIEEELGDNAIYGGKMRQ
jgi:enolase